MKVAIIGVSGAVGQEFLDILSERSYSTIDEFIFFGSKRSAGKKISFNNKEYEIKELQHNDDFKDVKIALVSAGASTSLAFADTITKYGAIMIDNSSAFRMDPEVPLIVPEVNIEDIKDISHIPKNIIANPNCTTIQLVVTLGAVEKLSPIKRVHVSTYQSASGAGAEAMKELILQMKQVVSNQDVTLDKFAYQLALNLIPQIDQFTENAYTKEEMKMYNETRKIMHSSIEVSATCVRVPVLRAHSESIWVETEDELTPEQVREAFENYPGIQVIDNIEKKEYPMPLFHSKKDKIFVGRIRKDISNSKGIAFWSVSDQIRKGAALNAVQIMEHLLENRNHYRSQ